MKSKIRIGISDTGSAYIEMSKEIDGTTHQWSVDILFTDQDSRVFIEGDEIVLE